MKKMYSLLYFLICALSVLCWSSCTLSVSPDGTRTYGVDADTAIEILNNK